MRATRPLYAIVAGVILITAAAPPLREQARLQWLTRPRLRGAAAGEGLMPQWLASYRAGCLGFVQRHHPGDARMLLAAAHLAPTAEEAIALCARAADLGAGPAARAAHAELVLARGPRYLRLEALAADQIHPGALAEAEHRRAASGLPPRLSPEQAEPLLSVLASWVAAEPDNALPLAAQAWVYHGLGRDREALARIEQAARAGRATAHVAARAAAVADLLSAMGMPRPEALSASGRVFGFPVHERLEESAAIVFHQGLIARAEGRGEEAVGRWLTVARLGGLLQESADTVMEFSAAAAVQSLGGSPVWVWVSDQESGSHGGPLMQGRYFQGPHHRFFVEHAGEGVADGLRDELIRVALRARSLRAFLVMDNASRLYGVAAELMRFGQIAAWFAAALAIAVAAAGAWSRRAADAAAAPGAMYQLAVAVPALLLLSAGAGVVVSVAPLDTARDLPVPRPGLLLAAVGVSVGALLALALAVAPLARREGAPLWQAWRGVLRRAIPLCLALAALVYLGLGVSAAYLRARWVYECHERDGAEMARVRRVLAHRWQDPPAPRDAWRAEPPPAAMRGSP